MTYRSSKEGIPLYGFHIPLGYPTAVSILVFRLRHLLPACLHCCTASLPDSESELEARELFSDKHSFSSTQLLLLTFLSCLIELCRSTLRFKLAHAHQVGSGSEVRKRQQERHEPAARTSSGQGSHPSSPTRSSRPQRTGAWSDQNDELHNAKGKLSDPPLGRRASSSEPETLVSLAR